MLAFQRVLEQIERHGAWVVGASSDSPFVQKAWARELELDYPMFSDPQREAGRAFDVLIQELSGIRDVARPGGLHHRPGRLHPLPVDGQDQGPARHGGSSAGPG